MVAAAFSSAVCAQTWPTRPVTLVVPFAAGGGSDVIARVVAEKMSKGLGQQVVIDNRPGAAGGIATTFVARAAPDGHTILLATSSTHVILPLVQKPGTLAYDPVKDFAPIGMTATLPNLMIVSPKVPANSVAEFIKIAKEQPGQLAFGSSGNGTITHLIGELFRARTGIDALHVPYRTGVQSAPDLMEGRIHFLFDNIIWTLPLVREGKLKALGVTTLRRSRLAPDLPTIAESGLPGFEAVTWTGLVAPANTPDPVIRRLSAEMTAALADPDTAEKLAKAGAEPAPSSPEGLRDLIAAETVKWGEIIRDAKVQIQ